MHRIVSEGIGDGSYCPVSFPYALPCFLNFQAVVVFYDAHPCFFLEYGLKICLADVALPAYLVQCQIAGDVFKHVLSCS